MRFVVIREHTRDGVRWQVGEKRELSDSDAKGYPQGLILPEQMVPKASTVAGPARRSRLSLPGRRSRTSTVTVQDDAIASSPSTTTGDESQQKSSTPATESGGTDTTES